MYNSERLIDFKDIIYVWKNSKLLSLTFNGLEHYCVMATRPSFLVTLFNLQESSEMNERSSNQQQWRTQTCFQAARNTCGTLYSISASHNSAWAEFIR